MRISVFTNHGPLNSKPVFASFIKSLRDAGEEVLIDHEGNSEVIVIWSVLWLGRMQKYKPLWDKFRLKGKPIVVLEVGGIRRNGTFKIAINGINRDADFANQTFDDKRWPLFIKQLKPWKQTGEKIIICGQHDASEQWKGLPRMQKWIEQQIIEIRKHTARPIIVRPHPRNPINIDGGKYNNVIVTHPKRDNSTIDDTNFKDTLKDAWAVINHSSNPAMEAVFAGIPVFVSKSSLCYEVGNTDLNTINNPVMPDREAWANKLAYTEWWPKEITAGTPWQRIKKRLKEKYL
jgi:hypothetical protein